mgnify:CR=1 FL=1
MDYIFLLVFGPLKEVFSSGSICLVLASHIYDELDYIRDYDEYKNYMQNYI